MPPVRRAAAARLVLALTLAFAASAACAQQQRSTRVPTPQDTSYPGTITLHVDASDTAQGIFRAHETIPVTAGPMTLPYLQWIPGDHSLRTLEDTTNDATAALRSGLPYRSWQMSEEYYSGGQMMWLAVDARIRALTDDRKSLDDFAGAFFGVDDGSFVTRTHTFDDVVAALNGVVKNDWAAFLRARVDTLDPPLQSGLAATGWKLVYTGQESTYEKHYDSRKESPRHLFNFIWSIGLTMGKDGEINDVRWTGPAFKAGVSTGATLVSVNGTAYTRDVLSDAITAAKSDKAPIQLLLKYQGEFKTVLVDYHDGLQYPHLVRVDGTPDYLSQIITARK